MTTRTGGRFVWLPVFFFFVACSSFGTDETPAPSSDGGTSSSSSSGAASSSGSTSSSGSASSSGSSGSVDGGIWEGCGLTPFETAFDTLVPNGMTEESDVTGENSVLFSKVSNGLGVAIAAAATSAQHSLVYSLPSPPCLQLHERITLEQKPASPGYKVTLVSFNPNHNVLLVILPSAGGPSLQIVEQDISLGSSGYRPLGVAALATTTTHDIVFEYRHGDTVPTYTLSLDGASVPLSATQFHVENPTAVRVGAPYVDPGGAGSYVLNELTIR